MPQLKDLSEILSYNPDIVVVGAGNAAMCCNFGEGKRRQGFNLRSRAETEKGGNSHFTGELFDLRTLV